MIRNVAAALLAGAFSTREIVLMLARATGSRGRWRSAFARRLLSAFDVAEKPSCSALFDFIAEHRRFIRESQAPFLPGGRELFLLTRNKLPLGTAAVAWGVPQIATARALANWLGLPLRRLEWLADGQGRTVTHPDNRVRHYRWRWVPKRGGRARLLEIPKLDLREAQRRILEEVLDRIPPHEAAHAYRAGRSVASFVQPHTRQAIVLRFDLCDFFPSVPASRVHALLRSAGYPPPVARLLTALCTTRTPADVWEAAPAAHCASRSGATRLRYLARHLPQGAPTSPALANLCARRLDARLAGLAAAAGAMYTRYADDLAFSGDHSLAQSARRFQTQVAVIVAEEGFEMHFRKSRFMRRGVRQHLAGVVLNERPNVPRAVYDELKAILTNCVRTGPDAQNRDRRSDFRAYRLGRIGSVAMIHPMRGAKLRSLFAEIKWQDSAARLQ